jgi:outer membrane immunogenic protein
MKRIALLVAAAALSTSAAVAADLPLKAAPMLVGPSYNWSGFYLGVAGGWMSERTTNQYTNPAPATLIPWTLSQDNGIIGFRAGGQWQFGQFVLGVQGDFSETIDSRFAGVTGGSAFGPCAPSGGSTCQTRINSISTVGAKAGWAWDKWLLYGQGGWAGGQVNSRVIATATGIPFEGSFSPFYNGWFAGVGVDYVLFKGGFADLIVGVDYQHVDLGSRLHTSTLDAAPNVCPPGVNCRTIGATSDIVRASLTVKVNPFTAPVVAKY